MRSRCSRAKIARLQGITNQAETDAKAEETRIAELKAGTKEAETKRTAIGAEAGQASTPVSVAVWKMADTAPI